MSEEKDKEKYVELCDQYLIKSTAEHYEQQTNKLLEYFGEEYKIPDPLSLIGKRFKDKEKEFATLRKEN